MEKKFYNDNFENLIKGRSDDFRMLPSKKTWHSIYNDLHPSKKWPSITISLFLITALGLLSYLNTTSYNKQTLTKYATDIKNATITDLTISHKNITKQFPDNNLNKNFTNSNYNSTATNTPSYNNKKTVAKNNNPVLTFTQPQPDNTINNHSLTTTPIVNMKAESLLNPQSGNELLINNKKELVFSSLINEKTQQVTIDNNTVAKNIDIIKKPNDKLSENDKIWIDDYAAYNRPRKSIWNGRISYQIYATPNISFRDVSVKAKYDFNGITDLTQSLNHKPSLAIETGVNAIYAAAKNIRLKTGLQFNFTNYAVTAYKMNHPVLTTLTMSNNNSDYSYLEARIATFSNTSNSLSPKYHNRTYQVSIPIGIEYKIAGKEKVQWYAGASIQPTYLFAGNAYLISSDGNNYVKDGSLIRKWNINTALETFISYKTKNDVMVQFGPQYRYQLLSTYKKFGISENLYHLGMKFGVTKTF